MPQGGCNNRKKVNNLLMFWPYTQIQKRQQVLTWDKHTSVYTYMYIEDLYCMLCLPSPYYKGQNMLD